MIYGIIVKTVNSIKLLVLFCIFLYNSQESISTKLPNNIVDCNQNKIYRDIDIKLISKIQDISRIATNKDLTAIQKLIIEGANVNCQNEYGNTPIMQAIRFGRLDIVNLLLEYNVNINFIDSYGDIPLNVAARLGYKDIVIKLIQANAKTYCVGKNCLTPILEAQRNEHYEIVEILQDLNNIK